MKVVASTEKVLDVKRQVDLISNLVDASKVGGSKFFARGRWC